MIHGQINVQIVMNWAMQLQYCYINLEFKVEYHLYNMCNLKVTIHECTDLGLTLLIELGQ